MKKVFYIAWLALLACGSPQSSEQWTGLPPGFKKEQLRYPRVRNAYQQKERGLNALLERKQIDQPEIFLRGFKKEETLEVWAKNKSQDTYSLLLQYDFCSSSGDLGPKRKQGDGQIPEGFYHIDRFNPASTFYLSLGINYPNSSDRKLKDGTRPGGDIFIHGDCVTIGCIPITDDKIMELYILAVEAKNGGQERIPVHIFPSRMEGEDLFAEENPDAALKGFWENLQEGFQYFEREKRLPTVSVAADGRYLFR